MSYPTYIAGDATSRSVKTKSSSAAGTNGDPDIPLSYLDAGENHAGEVGQASAIVELVPTLDTSAYASGDVLFDTAALASAFRVSAGRAELVSVVVLDEDDQGVAFDIVFFKANSALGTFNGAPSITDAAARDIIGIVSIASGDYIDLGGCRVATVRGLNLLLQPTTGTTLYVAAITRGAPTYTASGLRIKLGVKWH